MSKTINKKLFVTITITLMVISAYTCMTSTAQTSTQTIQEKGLQTLNNVLNIDTTKYSITQKTYPPDPETPFTYFDVVTQESTTYTLNSENSNLKIHYTFGNGNIQMIQTLEKEGTPNLTTKTTNDVETAKNFLTNYQKYTNNKLYTDLKTTLNDIEPEKNTTKTSDNITLEMTAYDDFIHFKWYYTANGAQAPYTKYVTLTIQEGFLSAFVDNWQYFNIGSTTVNLTEKQAIDIAVNAAKQYAQEKLGNVGFNGKNVNESNICWTSLLLTHSLDASKSRSDDVLELYPTWSIGVALDKWYGQLYGLQVNIWADTTEIRSIDEAWTSVAAPEGAPKADLNMVSTTDYPISSSLSSGVLIIGVFSFSIALTALASVAIVYRKNPVLFSIKRRRYFKSGGVIFCVLIVLLMLFSSVAPAVAWTKTAVVWGSESSGATDWSFDPPNYNWRKSAQERECQRNASVYLTNWFENEGDFIAYNHQGSRNPGSTKTQIRSDINIQTRDNSRVVFVTFDHGVGNTINGEFHFMFEDQTGTWIGPLPNPTPDPSHGIYDEEIYNEIDESDRGKTMLAFINTCLSARTKIEDGQNLIPWQGLYNDRARSLPFAFTNRTVQPIGEDFDIGHHMSDDGYDNFDDGSQVFIGYSNGSASLEQGIPFADQGGNPFYWWVVSFFYYACYADLSINQALNSASNQFMGGPFFTTPLRNGFEPYWYNMTIPPGYNCSTLEVYGNGQIQLKSYGDDFQDGNYNGWTVGQGSWSVTGAKLRSQQGNSLIRTNDQFTNDRHVRVELKTLSSGSNTWDVPWVIAKYDSMWNNMIYALIHTDGHVELAVYRNGAKVQWDEYGVAFDPYETNTLDIDIVGTTAYVWVNSELCIKESHTWFDDFSGYTALYTHYDSTGEFDDITVIKQTS